MSFVGKWMELEIKMLSEVSQTQKDKYHPSPIQKKKNIYIYINCFLSYAEPRPKNIDIKAGRGIFRKRKRTSGR
jgi:hypothetical protein